MRLLVYAHSAVVPANQGAYAALAAMGVDLELVVPAAWKGDLHGTWLKASPLPGLEAAVKPVPVRFAGHVPLHHWREDVAARVRRFQPDAIYVEHESYGLATAQVARAAAGRPLLCRNNQNLLKRLPPPFGALERYVFRRLACLGVVNEAAGEVAQAKGYAGRIAYLPYTVDPMAYPPEAGLALRQSLGLEGLVVGYLGRLVPEKGLLDLMAAIEALPQGSVSLLVVGAGPMAESIQARLASWGPTRGRLVAAVPHDQAPAYLASLDLLALPSHTTPGWAEQFGRVLVEAAAAGVPSLGSDSGEIPHLIRRLGVGTSVPEGRPEAIRQALEGLLAQPGILADWKARARQAVQDQYSHEAGARRLMALVAEVAGGAGRG